MIYSCTTGRCWNQNVFTNLQSFVKFWKKSKNSPNVTKSNRIFPGKGRGDRALILTYLDSPMAQILHHYCLSFSILTIFCGKWVVKVGPQVQTLDPSLFQENSNPPNFFQTMFLFVRVLFLVKISAILDNILVIKHTKASLKEPFRGCWIGTMQNF